LEKSLRFIHFLVDKKEGRYIGSPQPKNLVFLDGTTNMNNQYHLEQEPSMRKSHTDQTVRFFTHDWETGNDQTVPFSEEPLLEGKIIAQMPDLGDCRTISDAIRSKQQSENWLNRIYSGFVFISRFPQWIWRSRQNINFKDFRFSFFGKQNIYRNLIVICLVVFIIGGGILIHLHKSNKKKLKESARQEVAQKVEPSSTSPASAENSVPTPPPAEKPATPQPTPPPAEKPATPQPTLPPAEKPATPQPTTPTVEKAEKPPITVPTATAAATTPKVPEKEKSNPNKANSPWERSATDNYSPWTMNSPGRLETSANPAVPTPNPTVPQPPATAPLAPMMPIVPNQPATTANTVINNSPNTNIVNPANTANNAVNNAFNNTAPYTAANNNIVNNTVPPVVAGQQAVPGPNDVVTVYSQQNIPLTSYRRTDVPPVSVPPQPSRRETLAIISPVYPPQPYNGQPNQNQYGQYGQQIVPPSYQGIPLTNTNPNPNNVIMPVPMQGVAPQPVPVPMTGAMPIPIQPVAPIQGTVSQPIPSGAIPIPSGMTPQGAIPHGMMPPAGAMPMSQPIPIQVIASVPPQAYPPTYPPAYSSPVPSANSPIPPSYYPPTSAVPYYQQSNTPTPYRRLY
jgi:hypothetical protein